MDHKRAIREFLQNLLIRKGDTQPFSDAASLLVSGRLQSVDAVEVVVFLESRFGVDFAKIGFDEEKVDTVDAIAVLVEGSLMTP
jgi:acyl carrier protein